MIPFYEWFNNVLLTSANSVPIQSLWTAFFTNPVDLNRAFQTGLYENGVGYYTLAAGAATNTAQGALGALFANSVTIPGEGMNVSKLGQDGMGPIKGNISSGRRDMENVSLTFLDTNLSFCDYNLRPWAIYAAHKSLKDPSVKTTLTVIQWAKTGFEKPLLPRAIWTFHDACPVGISSQEWNYGQSDAIYRQVDFAYNYYLLNAEPGITATQAINSVINNVNQSYTGQPVSVPKGGLDSHSSGQQVQTQNSSTNALNHSEHQNVNIPQDDMVSRGLNIGLDILNGNSNVTIKSDDMIERLKGIASNLQEKVIVNPNDVPERSQGIEQKGFVEKKPTGPNQEEFDHITRREPENEQSGKIPTQGNSKENLKGLADTPIFFPGDGGENRVKVAGRTVEGILDTPEIQTMKFQEIEIEKNGDVGRNIPLQIVNIKRDDNREGGNTKSQLKVVDKSDDANKSYGNPKLVNIPTDDSTKEQYGNPKIVNIKQDDKINR